MNTHHTLRTHSMFSEKHTTAGNLLHAIAKDLQWIL
jgi:hypothetical protein